MLPCRRVMRFLLVLLVLSPLAVAHGAPTATGQQPVDAERELAERYLPVIAVQRQEQECGPGEPYLPTDALSLVAHPDVELRDSNGRVVKNGPTAADLAAAPDDWYVDFPGDALRPGCDFERWFRANGDPEPTVYARVATDPDHPGRLALQYWFFWIYNDWNNLHEGDWEMIQIVFDVGTAQEALDVAPIDAVVAQHEGAERSPWAAVERDGDRPVVYPAGGSHATFFEQGYWLGKSASAGFGCDDTRGPSDRLDPGFVLLPETVDRASDPDGEFAWVGWKGRWGEKRPLFNNGPEGPIAKTQWAQPITWMENSARTSSLRMPVVGGDVTEFFCGAVERGSLVVIRFFGNPLLVAAALVGLGAGLWWLRRRTVWSPVVVAPLAQRRRSGQILRSAWKVVRLEWRQFLPAVGLVVLSGIAASLLRGVLVRIWSAGDVERWLQGDSAAGTIFSLIVGSVVTVPMTIAALVLALFLAVDLDAAAERQAWRSLLAQRSTVAVAAVVTLGIVVTGPVFVLVGVVLVARWGAAPALAARGEGFVSSLRSSSALTRGRRVATAVVVLLATTIAVTIGPLTGALLMVALGLSFAFVNIVAGLITAFMLPWLAVVLVMVHGDLVAREAGDEVTASADLTGADSAPAT